MDIAIYEPSDLAAVTRIWREVGWVEDDDEAAHVEAFFSEAHGHVARVDGDAESATTIHDGLVRYDRVDLALAAVTSVTTSYVGRKQGLARAVTARALVDAARRGDQVAMLGMFEQGFYDQLGFGTGSYDAIHRFDPATLRVPPLRRPPKRVGPDDLDGLTRALATRLRAHGGIALDHPGMVSAELAWNAPAVGLGFRDESGRVTHFLWAKAKGEHGPYRVAFLAYRSVEDLVELLSVLRSLGDQVRSVVLAEPPEIQLQDLIAHPGRQEIATRGGEHAAGASADAWWQARILDLPGCVAARRWVGPTVRFALELTDPVAGVDGWDGVAGTWHVEVGESSTAERIDGTGGDGPLLRATVNAFTRLWLGVRPATSLAVTDELQGPSELLAALDEAFLLPTPHTGLDF